MYRIVHTIYEGDTPVVQHVFLGSTREQALQVYAAHKASDAFLSACDDQGVYRGNVFCRSVVYELPPGGGSAGVTGGGWWSG
jgi:hypothetical protein